MNVEERASNLAARHAMDPVQRREIEKDILEEFHQAEAAARAEERKACADLCDAKYEEWCADLTSNAIQAAPLARKLADLIRARD